MSGQYPLSDLSSRPSQDTFQRTHQEEADVRHRALLSLQLDTDVVQLLQLVGDSCDTVLRVPARHVFLHSADDEDGIPNLDLAFEHVVSGRPVLK